MSMIMVEFDRSNNNSQRATPGHYSTVHQPHHGSPHLQHLDRPSAPSTPSPPYQYAPLPHLSGQQPPPMRQTPTSYPSPASYASPSMSAYQYPPQQAPPPASRGSPYSQTINLPPIRLNPPASQLPPPHEGSPILNPLPPPMHSGYYPHPHALPPPAMPPHGQHMTNSPVHQPLRYPLPSVGNPERIMSGGRHKKEIKRRTKTGCLTCRKRRIKCDEGHPTCKNCQKSKRDCLGYDPIFKAQPSPAAIQPAPAGGSTSGIPPSSYPYQMSPVAQGYQPALSTASSPTSSCDTYNDYPQIDPALDAATSHPHMSASPGILDSHQTYRPELKRPFQDRTSPFSSAASDTGTGRTAYTPIPRSATPGLSRENGQTAKRIKIDDLLSVGSSQPPSPPTSEVLAANISPTSTSVESMKTIYGSRYAPALDDFLEVSWFCDSGLKIIRSDSQLSEIMAEVFERFKARGGSYYEEEDPAIRKSNKDTDLLWAAVRLCYGTRIPVSDNRREQEEERGTDVAADDEGTEAYRRITIVENLLSKKSECYPASPRLPPSDKPSTPTSGGQFWHLLEQISTFKETGADADQKVHELIEECRKHVEERPNREVLHAIAELGHLHGESSKQRAEALQEYIQAVATDRSMPITSLDRRIAGRAMGLWTQPVTELAFCMPAV